MKRQSYPALRRHAWLLVIASLAAGIAALTIRRSKTTSCEGVSANGGTIHGIRYLETVRGPAAPNAVLPMIIVFHSRGGTPEGAQNFPGFSAVRIIRPAGFLQGKKGRTWFSKSSYSTKAADSMATEMRQRADQLSKFIAALVRCRPTIGRPIVTGSSEGGHMAYLLASTSPDLIGGAVAVLGYIPRELWTGYMAPTIGLHTTGDTTISYERTAEFWHEAQEMGADLHTETFSGGHEIVPDLAAAWRSSMKTFVDRLVT